MCVESRADKKSLGIYVHIPFCVRKCAYCDFLSGVATDEKKVQYVEKLLEEIRAMAPLCQDYQVDSIFIGGGTPSILDPVWIERILEAIYQEFDVVCNGKIASYEENEYKEAGVGQGVELSKDIEITVECNPGTLTKEKVKAYARAGVNRISLGLQSANNHELKLLGRIHTWEQFLESVSLVKNYFSNWNVDLMSALPGQTLATYKETLEKVLALNPTHISAYSLIIEEGTPFYDRFEEDDRLRQQGLQPKLLPDEETERAMYELTEEMLRKWGYHRYEISNYAKDGKESRHNNRYWLRYDYLGVGLGASSCMNNIRFCNTSDMELYLQSNYVSYMQGVAGKNESAICEAVSDVTQLWSVYGKEDIQPLSINEQMEETMYLGLRRMQGVDCDGFYEKFGRKIEDVFGHVLNKPEMSQLLKHSGKYLQLTQYGIDVSNYVLAQFLLEE